MAKIKLPKNYIIVKEINQKSKFKRIKCLDIVLSRIEFDNI